MGGWSARASRNLFPRPRASSWFSSRLLISLPPSGAGADPSRPPCRKAKDLRKQRRQLKEQQRLQEGGASSAGSASAPAPAPPTQAKTLEDLIAESLPEDAKHRLEVREEHEGRSGRMG